MSNKDKFVEEQISKNEKAAGKKMPPSERAKHKKASEEFWEKYFGKKK